MKRALILVVLISSLMACSSSKKAEDPQDSVHPLESEIPKLMELAGVPGFSIALIEDGRISWTGAFGVRSTDTNDPIDENTIFEAASLTKTITATTVFQLVESGKLDLDTPLFEYLPYPKLAEDKRYKKLTARLVLSHTSGLPNWGNRFIREPGGLWGYSGEGFLYLGRVVEKITGKNLDEFARETIFEPLGMNRTSYVWTDMYAKNGACGHDRHGQALPLRKTDQPNGGASLLTTPSDYAKFLCAILNETVLLPETIAEMISPQAQATKWGKTELDEHISWGFGWGIQPGLTGSGFWHWGNNQELRGYTLAFKDKKEGFVFFSNSENAFALAEPLSALITDEPQWGMKWLGFEEQRYDNPKVIARFSVEKAFINDGSEAGLTELAAVSEKYPDLFEVGDLGGVAQMLVTRRKLEEAAALFTRMVEMAPKRVSAWEGLGLVEMERKRFAEATQAFEKALDIRSSSAMAKTGIPWIKELVDLESRTVNISPELLKRYAGEYGPRKISLREGSLYYQREGRPEYRLKAINENTFLLEDYLRFRLRFIMDGDGSVTKLRGIYIEGRTDENERSDLQK